MKTVKVNQGENNLSLYFLNILSSGFSLDEIVEKSYICDLFELIKINTEKNLQVNNIKTKWIVCYYHVAYAFQSESTLYMVECSFTNSVVVGLSPVAVTKISLKF